MNATTLLAKSGQRMDRVAEHRDGTGVKSDHRLGEHHRDVRERFADEHALDLTIPFRALGCHHWSLFPHLPRR